MRALLLADLDNVLSSRGGVAELVDDARPVLESLAQGRRVEECVSVLAFNTNSVHEYELTWEALARAGEALGSALGARRRQLEVALAPTMPQAADVLLARLARDAPSERGAGAYQIAVLMSRDHDLRRGLESELYVRSGAQGWRRTPRRGVFSAWVMPADARPRVRTPPKPARRHRAEAPLLATAYTALVEQPTHAGWAADRRLDVDAGITLARLAQEIDDDPWLLSQVGATRKSLRGVSRVGAFPSASRASFGIVGEGDGVEIRGEAGRPATGSGPGAASVGIGAIRFAVGQATLASRLPLDVVRAAEPVLCDRRGVVVRAALQRVPLGEGLSSQPVTVTLRQRTVDGTIVAKVKHGSVSQPAAWWVLGDRRATSELCVAGGGILLAQDVTSSGVAYRVAERSTVRLGLRAPLSRGDTLRCDAPIAQGTVGQAWLDRPHGKPHPIAVYSPSRPVSPTRSLSVTPIHEVVGLGVMAAVSDELRALPLVVPS